MSNNVTYYGRIKATYAELFDKDGKKLFSIQQDDMGDGVAVVTDATDLDCEKLHVYLTDACAALIPDLALRASIMQNGAYVKPIAFDWKSNKIAEPKKNLLGIIGLAALGLLAFNK